MSARRRPDVVDEEDRLWPPDFATVLVVVVLAAILLIVTFEFWHTHFGSH